MVHSGCDNWQPYATMKINNRRILALLSTTAFVVVASMVNSKADETGDKQAYLDGSRRELVDGTQMPPDITGVLRQATLVSGTGAQAVFDTTTTITDTTDAQYVAGPYSVPYVNTGIAQIPYLDGVADTRDIVINMEGGNVGMLLGTYLYSDITSGKITHNITGGTVGTLIGGANMTDSTNARLEYTPAQVQGVEINISGGTVGQIRGGNTTSEGGMAAAHHIGADGVTINISGGTVGTVGQQDAIRGAGGSYDGVEGTVRINISGDAEVLGDVYAGGRQATVDSTEINISGGEISGNVYGGGSYDDTAALVTNDTKISISGGTINGDVYAAGMNDQVGGNTAIVMVGSTARVTGSLHGGSNNTAGVTPGTVGGSRSIDFGSAESAYVGAVRLADFTDVNVNNGSTTIESLTNAAEGTNVTVESNGTLNTRSGVMNGVKSLNVLGGTINIDMQGRNDSGVSGKSLTLASGSTVNVTNAADNAGRIAVFGFDELEDIGNVAITLNGETVSANLWDMVDGTLIIRELNARSLSLNNNQSRFYSVLQMMERSGRATPLVSSVVNSRDETSVKAMLDTMSGHEYATAMSSQIDGNMAHLRRLRSGMGKGATLGRTTTYAPACTDDKGRELGAPEAITDIRRWRVGVQGFYDEAEVDSDSRGDGYNRSESGAMLVLEYMADDKVTMGAAVSYGRTSLGTEHAQRRHEDNTRFDVYSMYGWGRWSFVTSLGMGFNTHHMKRHNLRSVDTDGYAVNFMQEVAFAVLEREKVNMQLFGAAESSWNRLSGFRENGGIAPLYVRKQDAWATDVLMGVRCNVQLPALGAAPVGVLSVQTGAIGSVGDVNPAVKMRFGGYDYLQECARRDRWGWEIGCGIEVPVSHTVSFFGTAEAILRDASHTLDAQVGMRVAF